MSVTKHCINILEIDTSTPDYIVTASISNVEHLFHKNITVKRSLSEYEDFYMYLLSEFTFYVFLPPPFQSSLEFMEKKTISFLECILSSEKICRETKVSDFFTGNFKFTTKRKIQTYTFNWIKENVEEIDLFYEEITEKIKNFSFKIQEFGKFFQKTPKEIIEIDPDFLLQEKIYRFLKSLERKDNSIAIYVRDKLNDELIHVKRWLKSLQMSLTSRQELLKRYSQDCKLTQKNLQKLEKIKSKSHISPDKVSFALEEFEKIKSQESSSRAEFRKASEELKPLLISHMNEIEMELIGIWGRWADFNRSVELEFLNITRYYQN